MPRVVPSGLQNLLNLRSCNTQTTLSIYTPKAGDIFVATDSFTISPDVFLPSLRNSGEIVQSILSPVNRVQVRIQNVDKAIGANITNEDLVKAEAVIGRYFRKEPLFDDNYWKELFHGEVRVLELNEEEAVIEIVNDLTVAGYAVGNWTLAENCQFVFKHAGTCGYSGGETVCNKKKRSKAGCLGRANEHRFGGMEFPDVQMPEPGTGDGGGGGGGEWPDIPCFIGDTMIWSETMIDIPIREIQIGDWCLCYDQNGIIHERRISEKKSHWVDEYLLFTLLDGRKLGVTAEHLILNVENEFDRADRFKIEDLFTVFKMSFSKIPIVSIEVVKERTEVFSIEVPDFGTHFANRIAVHNTKQIDY